MTIICTKITPMMFKDMTITLLDFLPNQGTLDQGTLVQGNINITMVTTMNTLSKACLDERVGSIGTGIWNTLQQVFREATQIRCSSPMANW